MFIAKSSFTELNITAQMKKLIEFSDRYHQTSNIAKTVRSLLRVPENECPRIINKAIFNIYVIGSAMVLYDCLPL